MSDYYNDEVAKTYAEQTEQQIIDLNRTIVTLRSKISILKKELEQREKIPVPRGVLQQIIDLENSNRKLKEDLEYYKKYVPVQVIINKEQKEKPTRRGGIPK
jgi:hypothetical protein